MGIHKIRDEQGDHVLSVVKGDMPEDYPVWLQAYLNTGKDPDAPHYDPDFHWDSADLVVFYAGVKEEPDTWTFSIRDGREVHAYNLNLGCQNQVAKVYANYFRGTDIIETALLNDVPFSEVVKIMWEYSELHLAAEAGELEEIPAASKEALLRGKLAETKAAEEGVTCVEEDRAVLCANGIQAPADLFVAHGEKVTLYKCEAESSSYRKAHELRMCWDNCVRDGIHVEEGVLIAQNHPAEVLKLIWILNQLSDSSGCPYHFRAAAWTEEGVAI